MPDKALKQLQAEVGFISQDLNTLPAREEEIGSAHAIHRGACQSSMGKVFSLHKLLVPLISLMRLNWNSRLRVNTSMTCYRLFKKLPFKRLRRIPNWLDVRFPMGWR
jgi:hypothetical protein